MDSGRVAGILVSFIDRLKTDITLSDALGLAEDARAWAS